MAFRETLIMLPDSLRGRRVDLMGPGQMKHARTTDTPPSAAVRGEVRMEEIKPGDPEYPPDDYSLKDGAVPTHRIIIEMKEDEEE